MTLKFFKKFVKQFLLQSPSTLNINKNKLQIFNNCKFLPLKKEDFDSNQINYKPFLNSFGELNKDKIFYVIKRTPGTGLFSNVTFVLNHLKIAKNNNFIPIVDMQNFITIYNEIDPINNTLNAWEYFFKNLSEYKLSEVYKSKNVLIAENKFYNFFSYSINDLSLKKLYKDHIFLQGHIEEKFNLIKKEKFYNKKVLGIHFRGSSYKQSPGHPFPASESQMLDLVKKILNNQKVDLIFLATEELNYLKLFINNYKEKLFFIKDCYRSNKNDAFKIYPRENHRYKLGKEIILETYLLSSVDYFIYINSNVSSAALAMNLNKNLITYKIENGHNSKNQLISPWIWYLKKILPTYLGGFGKIKL